MTQPTRRQLMAGSITAVGAAGAPAIADTAEPYTPPTEEDWRRLFVAMRRMTPAEMRDRLAKAEAMVAEQDGQSA